MLLEISTKITKKKHLVFYEKLDKLLRAGCTNVT